MLQSPYLLGIFALFSIWLVRVILNLRNQLHGINFLPGYRELFAPMPFSTVTFLLPRIPYITPGKNGIFNDKHSCFANYGADVISRAYAIPTPRVDIYLADAEVIKEVTSSRSRFPKPVALYRGLTFYGSNIIASEGDDWKRIKKVAAPAFSQQNNKLVWDVSSRVIDLLHNDIWKDKDVIAIDDFVQTMVQVTMFVIATAGFGRHVTWHDTEAPMVKHKMTFKHALHLMSTDVILKLIFPEPALALTERMRGVRDAFHELKAYILEMITEHNHTDIVSKHDLLSSLIDANSHEEEGHGLTDSELTGNVYVFLLAGHLSTAHALAYTFALLALYQDEQDKLYEHIKSVIPDGRMPTFDDMSKLTYTMAVLNETLRMFPPVVTIPKYSQEDTFFTTKNVKGEDITVPIPKGTNIAINVPGLHYNPRYWKDPHKFDPSRFLGDWPRDAFLPFSSGPRACLGKKFAETEALAVLSHTILRYKVTVTKEPRFAGETFEQTKERLLRTENVLTLTAVRLPLTFTRRE